MHRIPTFIRAAFGVVCLAFVTASASCEKAGSYRDLEAYLNDIIKINEEYLAALEKAQNANEMMKAIEEMTERSRRLAEQGEQMKKKYPNLASIAKNPPPLLKDEYEKLNALAMRLLGITPKIMKYSMHRDVMKAAERMAEESRKTGVYP